VVLLSLIHAQFASTLWRCPCRFRPVPNSGTGRRPVTIHSRDLLSEALHYLKERLRGSASTKEAVLRKEFTDSLPTRQGVRQVKASHGTYTRGSPLLTIHSLIDAEDIQQIDRLSEWVKTTHATQYMHRMFSAAPVEYSDGELIVHDPAQGSATAYGGGNDVTHIEGFAQTILPHLMEHIICVASEAVVNAQWFPHPRQLGIRCVETLRYHAGGELKLHLDSESIFTVVVMLSDPCSGDFAGGDFMIRDSNAESASDELLRAAPKMGDALIFDSNALHGVGTIFEGERRVLVLELWAYDDVGEGERRPSAASYKHRIKVPTMLMG